MQDVYHIGSYIDRSLQFIVAMLEGFRRPPELTSEDIIRDAYEATLKKHHNFIVQKSVLVSLYIAM